MKPTTTTSNQPQHQQDPHRRDPQETGVMAKQSANELEIQKQARATSWAFTLPPDDCINNPMQLLTTMGVSVRGYWDGDLGDHFVAWSLELQFPQMVH
jgi:hypothetical protein